MADRRCVTVKMIHVGYLDSGDDLTFINGLTTR